MAGKATTFKNVEMSKHGACFWKQTEMTLSEIRKKIKEEKYTGKIEIYAEIDGKEIKIEIN